MPTILGEDKQIFFTNQNYVKKKQEKNGDYIRGS